MQESFLSTRKKETIHGENKNMFESKNEKKKKTDE